MRAKFRPGMPKPADARTSTLRTEPNSSLFVAQQSQSMLARETAATLDAYAKGTPASLEKFYAARERIAREAGQGAGGSGAGSPAVADQGAAGGVAQAPRYDASRDPRLRR